MRTIILGIKNDSTTTALYNRLKQKANIVQVFLEDKEPILFFLKRRVKKLGVLHVASQILFKLIAVPFLKLISKKRTIELQTRFRFDYAPIPQSLTFFCKNINDPHTIANIQSLSPELILVNGTRILSKTFLNSFQCPIINSHAGITPLYRGVHGAYWALTQDDHEHCGVTVHMVDAGIDTGTILYQACIEPTSKDTFVTYPLLQMQKSFELLEKTIDDLESQTFEPKAPPQGQSRLWYHPGIFEYIKYGLTKNVW
ncbi:MAG: formyl transferase [Cytophagaceae bacterium]|nr:formyl transferase [Cytophagaceae bacterium]MDW8455804.1 formyl transferase [Cytophagaceae bacterium]